VITLRNLTIGDEIIVGTDLTETKKLYQLDGSDFMLNMRGRRFKIRNLEISTSGDSKITINCPENGVNYHFAFSDITKVVDLKEDEEILKEKNKIPEFFNPQNLV